MENENVKVNVYELELADKESLYGIFAGQIIMEDNFDDELEEFDDCKLLELLTNSSIDVS